MKDQDAPALTISVVEHDIGIAETPFETALEFQLSIFIDRYTLEQTPEIPS